MEVSHERKIKVAVIIDVMILRVGCEVRFVIPFDSPPASPASPRPSPVSKSKSVSFKDDGESPSHSPRFQRKATGFSQIDIELSPELMDIINQTEGQAHTDLSAQTDNEVIG